METTDLTVLGGYGFVGSHFWDRHAALNFTNSRNSREDYEVHTTNCINFISTVSNYNIFDNPYLDIDTNLSVLIRTLESWRHNGGGGCYNLISSWFVYGFGICCDAKRECDPCDPTGFYSITKRAAEQLLISYCTTYNLLWRILRLGSVVGPDPKASKQKNAVQWMVNEVVAGRDVSLYNGGVGYRHFITVEDAADAIALILDRGIPDSIYNVGAYPARVVDVIRTAKDLTHSNSTILSSNAPFFHHAVQVDSFKMATDRLKSLGFNPKHNTLESLVRFMLGPKYNHGDHLTVTRCDGPAQEEAEGTGVLPKALGDPTV